MLISSLILPNDNFEINYIEEEKIENIETKREDLSFTAELGKGRGSSAPISDPVSSISDPSPSAETVISNGTITPLSGATTTTKSISSHIDDGIALALSLIGMSRTAAAK